MEVIVNNFTRAVGDFNYKFCSPNYAMKHKTSQPFLLHKHGVISCAIAKGGALREKDFFTIFVNTNYQ